ncbi:MAG: bifunctional proline dehydrogenase/L-glutamate gamma-semialdehyde dehydrogenase PutA [Hyphomicrobiales bacterium]|nr:bifunctional proline dehydrogenase/L-glutamate gamma-semialdehyde dehydrogenase PutA [Hyphomicrobiales bacterium]
MAGSSLIMDDTRNQIRAAKTMPQREALNRLVAGSLFDAALRQRITERAIGLVKRIRADSDPHMMELFLAEYGLTTDEGVALMCLAEALLRVPDEATIDALIEDKIAPSAWGRHLGQSHSSLVNASTWALFVTGKVLNDTDSDGIAGVLRGAVKRLGEPVIRHAVTRVMKELGSQFVLGETIESAMTRAAAKEAEGYTYSYDMLGEAALTDADARRYHLAYADAIGSLSAVSHADEISRNPGISIKLSALHPRYEPLQRRRVMEELVPRARSLATLAMSAGIGLNIDAEEAGRLDLSLDVIEAVLRDPVFAGWAGFGVVVQAYGQRTPDVLDWLYRMADRLNRRIMVRLVKGAYWDTEIKHAQVEGLAGFPVFTHKAATDVSYLCCARKLLDMSDRIYPQFATHNAHTVAAILEMADDPTHYEFQRLHGMGEALHAAVLRQHGTRCRIYAPVGAHSDLLAYLVRRLLENGANSSFVNQIVDETVPPEHVAADPFTQVEGMLSAEIVERIHQPPDLYLPARINSSGWDLEDPATIAGLEAALTKFAGKTWVAKGGSGETVTITDPATGSTAGTVRFATRADAETACLTVRPWDEIGASARAIVLRRTADLYEANAVEIFALLMREAGKTVRDCVSELREAVDFLRYYAAEAERAESEPVGIFTCISPWNFPLAIFTGQVSAALAMGNGVLAKPAEATPLISSRAVELLKQAGVPDDVLILLPGTGDEVGAALTAHPRVEGVCFTGSTATARRINITMAEHLEPHAPLIAETGGLNAMIVDSTALPEQAVADVVASAFQSTGQRCSALRMLYLQDDIAEVFLETLHGAMDALAVGNPQDLSTDIGPVIDAAARQKIDDHIAYAASEGRRLKQIDPPSTGTFVGPAVLSVDGIEDLKEEIFGPVLHVATFGADDIDQAITAVNDTGYGLTFGLQTRIDDRVQHVVERIAAGNIYINRNQIGAVVGSQPFGGEGLSGTGPKAGGPRYLARFARAKIVTKEAVDGPPASIEAIEEGFRADAPGEPAAIETLSLPGPTGESNQLSLYPRGRVLCLGPSAQDAEEQASAARRLGCKALAVAPGVTDGLGGRVVPADLERIKSLDAVVGWSADLRETRQALARRPGPIVPLLSMQDFDRWLVVERHVCINTTAAGGNPELLAADSRLDSQD